MILLFDPDGVDAWGGSLRIVVFATCELDAEIAQDPLLPEVAWSWLTESLEACGAGYSALGGTVTATSSTRFGDIAGPQRADDLEMRASWTADEQDRPASAGLRRVFLRSRPACRQKESRCCRGPIRSRVTISPLRLSWTGRFGCLTTDGRRADTSCDNGPTDPERDGARAMHSTRDRRIRTMVTPSSRRGRVGGRPVSNSMLGIAQRRGSRGSARMPLRHDVTALAACARQGILLPAQRSPLRDAPDDAVADGDDPGRRSRPGDPRTAADQPRRDRRRPDPGGTVGRRGRRPRRAPDRRRSRPGQPAARPRGRPAGPRAAGGRAGRGSSRWRRPPTSARSSTRSAPESAVC